MARPKSRHQPPPPAPRPVSAADLPRLDPADLAARGPRAILDAASAHLADVAFDSPAARANAVGALAARIGAHARP